MRMGPAPPKRDTQSLTRASLDTGSVAAAPSVVADAVTGAGGGAAACGLATEAGAGFATATGTGFAAATGAGGADGRGADAGAACTGIAATGSAGFTGAATARSVRVVVAGCCG